MADNPHATLTGADLHEPKGVESASDNAIAQASGNAVTWSDEINPSSVTLSDTVWDDKTVSLIATNAGSVNAPEMVQLENDGASSQGVMCYHFSPSTEEEVFFDLQIPHSYKEGTNLRPHVHWCPTSTNTGDVVWALEYTVTKIGETFANTTTITVTDTADGTINKHQVAQFSEIDGTDFIESEVLMCRFYRDATDAADTYTGDSAALSFDIHFEKEKFGSDDEYPA